MLKLTAEHAASNDLGVVSFLVQQGDDAFHLGRGLLLRILDPRVSREAAMVEVSVAHSVIQHI